MHIPLTSDSSTKHSIRSVLPLAASKPLQETAERIDEIPEEASESSITVAEYVESRFVPGHVRHKAESGRRHYQAILKHILRPETVDLIFSQYSDLPKSRLSCLNDWPYLDEVKLCNLGLNHIQGLIERATARGYSPQTVKHIKNVVGAIISHAQNEGIFKRTNPALKIRLQPLVHRTPRNITMQQAKAIVALLDGADQEIAILSLATGMSAYEICKLRWTHVNLSAAPIMSEGHIIPPRSIMVRREAASGDSSSPTVQRLKTVEIPDVLFRRLLQIRRNQEQPPPQAFVLDLRGAIPTSESTVSRARLVRVGRELGIPWLSWQVLKRGHQVLMAELRDQLSCMLLASARR